MPVASVGGSIGLNPTVKASFNILKNPDAKTLAGIIVSVGLAQNFAALKALVSTGIQKGHMKLQARSLALFAGAENEEVDIVVEKLLETNHINSENAKKILEKIREEEFKNKESDRIWDINQYKQNMGKIKKGCLKISNFKEESMNIACI